MKPTLKYIETGFGKEHADAHTEPLNTLQEMRNKARSVTDGSGSSGRSQIFKYLKVLETLDNRVPLTETDVAIPFTWSDAFSKKKVRPYPGLFSSSFRQPAASAPSHTLAAGRIGANGRRRPWAGNAKEWQVRARLLRLERRGALLPAGLLWGPRH